MTVLLHALANEMALTFWRCRPSDRVDTTMPQSVWITKDGQCVIWVDGVLDQAQTQLLQKILCAIQKESDCEMTIRLSEVHDYKYVLIFGVPDAAVGFLGKNMPWTRNISTNVGTTTILYLSALTAMLQDATLKKACWQTLKHCFLASQEA